MNDSTGKVKADPKAAVMKAVDGNEAAALIAHRLSEVIAIYPITPSSTMGELADEWSAAGRKNIWGEIPSVTEMQSEGGAISAVHGALQAGALCTTFTASQGLLLMIPTMYKIAGELTPFAMHVTARAIAAHALSIFGDHSDVMACRQTGFALLASNSPQEAHDMALVAHAATLVSRVPFMHFFDGFRTSHEVQKIKYIGDEVLHAMVGDDVIKAHRARAMTPDHPIIRGTAQNPDTFFQAREACNLFYSNCPAIVQQQMDVLARLTGRQYKLFEYYGHPDAERVIIIMGSGAETAQEAVDYMVARGEKVGVLVVRLYRPWDISGFINALPKGVKSIAVLDRTKEPGTVGEPLYQDVLAALHESRHAHPGLLKHQPDVIGGRYGLSCKEFTPAMVISTFDELARANRKAHFTVGINDDVTHLSLPVDDDFDIEPDHCVRAVFFGLGSDGTVGANKNSIKIIGDNTDNFVQGYFVYDSKKSGTTTVSHLRFSTQPIRSPYLIRKAQFVACHQFNLMEKLDVVGLAAKNGTLLLNSPYMPEAVWSHLPLEVQNQILERNLKVYTIDALTVAREAGVGNRVNTVMQACFFKLCEVLPAQKALDEIRKAIKKTFGRKGDEVVAANLRAVDAAESKLFPVPISSREKANGQARPPIVPAAAPDFVRNVTAVILAGKGDLLPVSAFPVDGTWPVGTTKWEKRNVASEIPVWDSTICIQCNKCAMVCPHAAIRPKVYSPEKLAGAPESFLSVDYKASDFPGCKYTLQVAPEDCTGCGLCVMVCPAKNKLAPKFKAINMQTQEPLREKEVENWKFFLALPEADRSKVRLDVKGSQFLQPLFEFSGACAGCGETPYVKLITQLFGDRMLIANATGCSSIYGGNLPTTPYCTNREGRGPTWNNSLFENNAEFGMGMRLALDAHREQALQLLQRLAPQVGQPLADSILKADQRTEVGIDAQRARIKELRQQLRSISSADASRMAELADYLVSKSVWILGGDGWAYDIGYGGLDHVLASGKNVKVLVMDTEVYSNTGGQQSKSTPTGAVAKFAAAGKSGLKKDLGLMAMAYGNVYVASIAFGAKDAHTVKVMQEAESFDGPALIIAYSHCIAHGFNLAQGAEQQKLAVESGYWPLYRFDPRRHLTGENPFQLDSTDPRGGIEKFMLNETRFRVVEQKTPDRFRELLGIARQHVIDRYSFYQNMARPMSAESSVGASSAQAAKPAVAEATKETKPA